MIKIGEYDLGIRMVVVTADPSISGGSFNCVSSDHGKAEIVVGFKCDKWQDVISIFMHEALEMAYSDLAVRFKPCPDFAGATDGYVFMMDHNRFSEAVARVGWMTASVFRDLADAYRKHQAKSKSAK